MLEYDAKIFVDRMLKKYVRQYPNADVTSLWRQFGTSHRGLDEIRPYINDLDQRISAVSLKLSVLRLHDRESGSWTTNDEKSDLVNGFADALSRSIASELLVEVEEYWADKKKRGNKYLFPGVEIPRIPLMRPAAFTAAEMEIAAANRSDLKREIRSAENELEVAELELRHAITALTLSRRADGLGYSLWALQIVTVFAIVLPLAQMSIWGSMIDRGQRVLFVSLFLASLLIFFGYLAFEIKRATANKCESTPFALGKCSPLSVDGGEGGELANNDAAAGAD